MGGVRTWLKARRTTASVAAIALIVGVPVTFAVLHPGFPVTDVDLNSKDVWVVNQSAQQAGRLNLQIDELNGHVTDPAKSFDVVQDGDNVFVRDTTSNKASVARISASSTTFERRVEIPADATISYGGGRIAVFSAATGNVWAFDATGDFHFDKSSKAALLSVGKTAQGDSPIAVTTKGTVIAVNPSTRRIYRIDANGVKTSHLLDTEELGDYLVSAVGEEGLVFDLKSRALFADDGHKIASIPTAVKLQKPGPQSDHVFLSTGTSLWEQSLADFSHLEIDAGITAETNAVSAPVFVNGCAHAAWGSAQTDSGVSGVYLHYCPSSEKKSETKSFPAQPENSVLEFRVNQNLVVLNNFTTGSVFALSNETTLSDLIPKTAWPEKPPSAETSDQQTKSIPTPQPFDASKHSDQNTPPKAVDDDFAVRPEKSTKLPILLNDTDDDGDVLTVSSIEGFDASQGELDLIDGGRSIQFRAAKGVQGPVSFRYTVTDGRPAGTATAQVNVAIHPTSINTPPVALRSSTVFVEAGQSVSYNVLDDWIDQDGDDLHLTGANPTTADGVRFTPQGVVTFSSSSGDLGPKTVEYSVSDGSTAADQKGTLTVVVDAVGSDPPNPVADFATTFTGQPVTIKPLENDQSPSGVPLNLVKVDLLTPGVQVTPNVLQGSIDVSSQQPGSYYLTYVVGAGDKKSTGLIRVDIRQSPTSVLPPIAVADTVYLRGGESSTVAVLANDVSPGGAVLGVQSLEVSPAASKYFKVELLGNTLIRVAAPGQIPVDESVPLGFTYTISDGTNSSTATVSVVPLPLLVKNTAPVAVADAATVRVSDIVSVSVMANDYHPDGVLFSLDPELLDAPTDGVAFVTGKQVRFQAPDKPGTYSVSYGITDVHGQSSTARVTFTVDNPEKNTSPVPLPITARVFAGAQVDIPIPLDGIDPDGDSVTLGDVSGGDLGIVSSQTSNAFQYRAGTRAGTDSLTYEVSDAYGGSATGTIRIAVIPRGASMQPTAKDDIVSIRPSRIATVNVLENDSDPNGYEMKIEPGSLVVPKGISARIVENRVEVSAPGDPGEFSLKYTLTNGKGGSDTATIAVTVDKNAPQQYPYAADFTIKRSDFAGKTTYDLDVLADAQNPGGKLRDLVVTTFGPNASAAELLSNGKLRIALADEQLAIAYSVTTADKTPLSASAFIVVPAKPRPGLSDPPFLSKSLALPMIVAANQTVSWTLDKLLTVPSGRPAILTSADDVIASHADHDTVVFTNQSELTFKPTKDYRGPASVRFKVTDGKSASDPDGSQAWITLPIQVGDPDQRDIQPTFTAPTVNVAPDEPVQINLRDSTSHPNPALIKDVSYRDVKIDTTAVSFTQNDATLTFTTDENADIGTVATVTLKLHSNFGQLADVPASFKVTVVSSSLPLAQAIDDQAYTKRGSSIDVDVLANDEPTNPAPGTPLKVIDAKVVNAGSGASVSYTSTGTTVNPNSSFIGDVQVQYTIRDKYGAAKNANRDVTGRAIVTVWDAPDQPAAPSIVTSGDSTVTISFQPPASTNGSTITGYSVRSSPASGTPSCDAGVPCQFTGLTNGTAYQFYVTAHGSVPGTSVTNSSAESAASAARKPFAAPIAPSSPTITSSGYGPNGTLTMSWAAASSGGGAARYTYQLDYDGFVIESGTTAGTVVSTGGKPSGDYYFIVHTCNEGSDGQWELNPANCSSGASSNSTSISDPPPPPPTWAVQVDTSSTCAQQTNAIAGTSTNPKCQASNGHTWIPGNTALTVSCYVSWSNLTVLTEKPSIWYYISSGGYSGYYVAHRTLKAPYDPVGYVPSGMPGC